MACEECFRRQKKCSHLPQRGGRRAPTVSPRRRRQDSPQPGSSRRRERSPPSEDEGSGDDEEDEVSEALREAAAGFAELMKALGKKLKKRRG